MGTYRLCGGPCAHRGDRIKPERYGTMAIRDRRVLGGKDHRVAKGNEGVARGRSGIRQGAGMVPEGRKGQGQQWAARRKKNDGQRGRVKPEKRWGGAEWGSKRELTAEA